jgi:predicted MPP superfamily phosphohydrolase
VNFIFTIIGLMVLLDGICCWVLARVATHTFERTVLFLFMGAQILGLLWIISARLTGGNWDRWLPKFAVSAVFIWHFIGLGFFTLVGLGLIPVLVFGKIARAQSRSASRNVSLREADAPRWSRRDFVRFAAALAPAFFTLSLTGVALTQLRQFRVRRFVVPIPNLPPDLDGATIAQVSDIHVGRFTSGRVLDRMVEMVNKLDADLVLLTGDLINDALVDLAHGLDLARKMHSRSGLYLIEGNHDLIENPAEFERRVKESGIPFLLDESAIVTVRGTPLQLLGLSWTRHHARDHDAEISRAVRALLQQRQPEVFPILLAHHPHAFDAAAEAGMPLTLSGHTHGGQLMLNEQLGFGPAMFRYWSGLYERGESKLIVSNGVGNWFPLRTNAPAEIVHITLRSA